MYLVHYTCICQLMMLWSILQIILSFCSKSHHQYSILHLLLPPPLLPFLLLSLLSPLPDQTHEPFHLPIHPIVHLPVFLSYHLSASCHSSQSHPPIALSPVVIRHTIPLLLFLLKHIVCLI